MPPRQAFASQNLRCCTLIGHVDHGKSSYADSLLAANGIISSRAAGQIRYLDSREDEQERGITMEASAVSLTFKLRQREEDGTVGQIEDYTLNLIDTPGHVDFSSEVSTASRLCDGALVIVDVVEGVCTQTIAVLRQAWLDGLRTVLVVNKMDRLITELKLTPTEAHHRVLQLVEQVNAVIGGFYAAERMEQDQRGQYAPEDDELYFDPPRGNVIFASAMDQWAFRLERFSTMYAQKLGIKESHIRGFLWGHYYLDPKTKRVLTKKQHDKDKRNLKPMFVQFVLDNIWSVYEHTVVERNQERIDKIIATLGLSIHARDLRSKEPATLMQAILSQWLPLSACTFAAVVRCLPAPSEAQRWRVPRIIRPDVGFFATPDELAPRNDLERDLFESRSTPDAYTVAYVSKMFAVRHEDMPENKRVQLTAEQMRERGRLRREAMASTGAEAAPTTEAPADADADAQEEPSEVLLGFARLYSGQLRVGDTLYAILPKFDPSLGLDDPANAPYVQEVRMTHLYMMMGRDLLAVQRVPAGNVFAARGLEGVVLRNGTLLRAPQGGRPQHWVNLAGVRHTAAPMVRVALEPRHAADMPRLAEGLRLLNQADPCVQVIVQDNGEHCLVAAGELHLERCLRDLRERFARCDIQASPPLVPFRETCVKAADMALPKTSGAPRGTVHGTALQGAVHFTLRVLPLPSRVTDFLVMNGPTIRRMQRRGRHEEDEDVQAVPTHDNEEDEVRRVCVRQFPEAWRHVLQQAGGEWAEWVEAVYAFGPKHVGPNVLLDPAQVLRRARPPSDADGASEARGDRELSDAIEAGFQLAMGAGPLCAEPVQGLAVCVEELHVDEARLSDARMKLSQLASTLISSVREACRQGLLDWSPRLMLAMYACDIQTPPSAQGKVHAVLARRRAQILSEEIREGTLFFTIRALLPVVESFGLADEMWKRTSGAASAQLTLAGFRLFDQDPFWVPRTEEELEDLGEKGDRENMAKRYMNLVRKRKGLRTDQRLVASAEKQRTLKST
ncbi:Cytoplasmic GTPase/eEF2-like protein (ribosomal biogenesis) [Malassezia equina]|uniref:Ribosome assembly protein 1 n=1 Tax=Malassezia equina TaxID=1381935 RepID=A0AAF0EBC4_9BASI|nr:Cytoplasmic GTPase/eEF2-like protein (ribosomal biogenesis) [Malassezia equina]